MKKFLLLVTFILVLGAECFADIAGSRFKITESVKEFDVMYYLTQDMQIADNPDNNDVGITQTFTINKKGISGEVRYSLFTDCEKDDSDLSLQYAMMVYMCLNNIAGFEVPSSYISVFRNEDVAAEFNGDFGCSVLLQDCISEYADGFKYMMVEFFYKYQQGLVMRTFLFNELDFLGLTVDGSILADGPWYSNYHTFRFMERDSSGKYIVK